MSERWILQFCHCHYGPFLDVARQYAALFKGSPYKVLTVYLTDKPSEAARTGSASDEVIFLDYDSKAVRGLKLSAIRALRKIAASRDFALVIAHRAKPIYIACLATNLPVIGVQHSFGDYHRAARRWFANRFRQRLSLLGVSDAVRDDMRRYLPNWPADRIETLHNRLDVEACRREILARKDARAALGLPDEAKIIGNVGRLHPDKDQKTLLAGFAQALPHLPPGTLLAIAGSGRLEADLKAQAQASGIAQQVIFLGQVPEIWRLFAAFDLFVLSSDHEPFGMVLLEAMAANVPIMATDCGGAPEIVTDDNALFPLGDSRALAEKLTTFFSAPPAGEAPLDRLKERFSDEAARRRFFALPMVQKALGS
ncbi:glycosyltransferase [Azonexus sp.]|jgi:glycosyltransferase involved in cell wall biosynthesis|uniref:glycosyltransferase n=1 Tax=Azonexus sp. TaxID=1872668 RepID=UPI0028307BC9|nr:glycosyltransferase [Azonexus sp.]MDR1996641.1 glycosyltransferase [Azonexus sp.]